MKYHFILLAIVFHIFTSVDGRHLHKNEENSETNHNIETKHVGPERHTRNRRQSYYTNYQDNIRSLRNIELTDYLTDMTFFIRDIATSLKELTNNNQYRPFYYNRREDRTSNCEESIRKILVIVEELATRAKYTPPLQPPQVIFVPYPLYEKTKGEKKNVTFPDRLGLIDDINRIWMETPKEIASDSEEGDGSRPVSFKPLLPKSTTVAPPPSQERERIQTSTSKPVKKPSRCEGAILSCCGLENEKREECFALYNCSKSYETGKACDTQVINMVIDNFSKMYGPINEF